MNINFQISPYTYTGSVLVINEHVFPRIKFKEKLWGQITMAPYNVDL